MSSQVQAVVLIDPLNDFLHPNGKLYPRVEESLTKTNTIENLRRLLHGARKAGIPIYYGLHQKYVEGNYNGWKHLKSVHKLTLEAHLFEGWGGDILAGLEPVPSNGDVVATRHLNSNSFKNTDLDYQLRQGGREHLIFVGMATNTCVEATARDAAESGYKVTLITDATAGFSQELKEAATNLTWPTLYMEEVISTDEWLATLGEKAAL
ncbi:hypothetical protein G647_07371 [Cladophialophora carrionii CBS 160.54]|uniref:Isochorismatase-like domain-containing protein n=1 Tax=Cladophialophora carrionii CBS 160.54 TaxID=1279043 RepID=V9D418_9EURO|nr:uncharacterized protein G647_07371 [Cladophialophora carrionii CBS 160.54]ETI21028.1 hypothetical protein G647_07371 [Cladophialophora carrionii CBS 160.54]